MSARHDERQYDVAIVGGGSAGLSAAVILAAARRSVAVIDDGHPRNAPAAAVRGLLGREGINPGRLLETAREEAASYGAHITRARVAHASGSAADGFALRLGDGAVIGAEQLLLATGVRDELPAIPGLAERWGRDVVHCPYCHGWEIRDQRIGLLATGPMSAMQALLFHQWSEHIWFFPNGMEYPDDQFAKLRAMGITIVAGNAVGVDVADDRLTGIRFADHTTIELDALAVPALTSVRMGGIEDLGVEVAEGAAGVHLVADAAGHTSVPGVWAAGNAVNPGLQVSESVANGARVAMTINTELVFARADRAIADRAITGQGRLEDA